MIPANRVGGSGSSVADDCVEFAQTVRISADAGVTIEAAAVTIAVTITVTNDELRNFIGLFPKERHDGGA
jgi:hypothetical protein